MKTIRSIPHEIHVVEDILDIFEDAECKNKRKGAVGIIITSESSDGSFYRRLFHTSKTDYYEKGKRVTWEWDLSRKFDESWYIDKKDGKTKKINGSLDFIGRQLDEI